MPLTGAKRFQVRGEGGREAVATPVGCGFLAAVLGAVTVLLRQWTHREGRGSTPRQAGLWAWRAGNGCAPATAPSASSRTSRPCTRSCWSGGSPEVGTEVPRIRWRLLGGLPCRWNNERRLSPRPL